jgi:hypothetical protein
MGFYQRVDSDMNGSARVTRKATMEAATATVRK